MWRRSNGNFLDRKFLRVSLLIGIKTRWIKFLNMKFDHRLEWTMVIELFAINRYTWKCNRRIIIDETSIWNVKKRKKSIGYAMLAIQLHFSLSSLHATFLHTPPVMLGWRGYCNRDSPRKIWKTSSPSPPFYDSCNRLIIARAFAKRWRMLRGFTSELAFI